MGVTSIIRGSAARQASLLSDDVGGSMIIVWYALGSLFEWAINNMHSTK